MKNIKILAMGLCLVLVSALTFVGLASAQNFKAGDMVGVASNETVNSMLFAAGNNVDIAGTVNGDVYCAGQTLTISGTINGDVFCVGQTVLVSGTINGNIRIAGQTVTLNSIVSGSATIGAQTLVIDKNASIGRDLLGGTSDTTINGTIKRDMVAGAKDLNINGSIGGNINGYIESLNVGSAGVVSGKIEYTSKNNPFIADGGKIVGTVTRTAPKETANKNYYAPMVFTFGWIIYCLISWVLLAIVLVALFPRIFAETTEKAIKKPGAIALTGLIGVILIPVLFVILLITFIGMPLAFLVLFAWILITLLSTPFAGYLLGRVIMTKSKQPLAIMAVGTVILIFTYFIPIIGFITMLGAYLFGMGMILNRGKQLIGISNIVAKKNTKKA